MSQLKEADVRLIAQVVAQMLSAQKESVVDKPLELRWVPKFSGKDNFNQWKFLWQMGVNAYLPKPVKIESQENEHKEDPKRIALFNAALLKSAEGNKEYTTDLQTLIEKGIQCEAIIDCLEKLYTPYVEDQRLEVVRQLNNFSRQGETRRRKICS
eukprot:GHVR01136923.1.p1 GENE.GHVR01136923.1~~GHVR01136923.1.p1  ORF type:complete len:155 (-),score=16.91 GHVR01136923.1:424-888(-)